MRLRTIALASALALGALAAWSATTGTAGAIAPSHLLTFRDHRSAMTFAIELQQGRADTGTFVLRSSDGRLFISRGHADLRIASPTSTILRYEGVVDVVASRPTRLISVAARLNGQVDVPHHTAEITLTTDTERLHLVQPAIGRGELSHILTSFERAMTASDWSALYDLASSDLASSYARDAFVANAHAQEATVGTVRSMRRTGTGEVTTNPAGLSFFVATYEIQRAPGAAVPSATYDVYFVMEDGWRLWFTAQR